MFTVMSTVMFMNMSLEHVHDHDSEPHNMYYRSCFLWNLIHAPTYGIPTLLPRRGPSLEVPRQAARRAHRRSIAARRRHGEGASRDDVLFRRLLLVLVVLLLVGVLLLLVVLLAAAAKQPGGQVLADEPVTCVPLDIAKPHEEEAERRVVDVAVGPCHAINFAQRALVEAVHA